jgi:hypothetical protein
MSTISTAGGHTGRLANVRPVRHRELSKAKSVATSLRSRCWAGFIISTIWLHDHPDGHFAPYSLCGHWHDERRNRLRSNQRGALETATSQPEAVRHRHDLPNEAELCKVLSFRSAEPARITQAESERVINTKDRIDTVRDAVRNILI